MKLIPRANITYEDVEYVHKGFVPASDKYAKSNFNTIAFQNYYGSQNLRTNGFYKIVGTKYTTAVNVAETVLKIIFSDFKKTSTKISTKIIRRGNRKYFRIQR